MRIPRDIRRVYSVKIRSTRAVQHSLYENNEETLESIPLTCTVVLCSIESLGFIMHQFCLISPSTIGFLLRGFVVSNRQTTVFKIDLRVFTTINEYVLVLY